MTSTFMLLSHSIILACDRETFEALLTGLHDAVQPQGILERFAFERLVTAAWNIRRAQAAEASLVAKSNGEDPLTHPDTAADARRYLGLGRQWESSYKRAQNELADLQTARALRNPDAGLPPLAHMDKLARCAKRTQSNRAHEVETQLKMLDVETKQMLKDYLATGTVIPLPEERNKPNQPETKQTQLPQAQSHQQSAERTQSQPPPKPGPFVRDAKVGRNEPCPCGSGQKYKRCCGNPVTLTSARCA